MSNPLILLVGKSGSGKTTVADALAEKYGLKVLQSYTTRPKRHDGETGHEFVTYNFYMQPSHKVAHTYFHGHHYWATQEQCDAADVYVIDPDGVESFRRNYSSDRNYIIIYLDVKPFERFRRMCKRGDDKGQALSRILHDRKKFGDFKKHKDVIVMGGGCSVESVARRIYYYHKMQDVCYEGVE